MSQPYATFLQLEEDEHIIKIGGLMDMERDAAFTSLIGRLVAAKEMELLEYEDNLDRETNNGRRTKRS